MEVTRRDGETFREALAGLKRRGCNLLVAGETDVATRQAASRQLFGDPSEGRDRFLVTVGETDPDQWLPESGRVVEATVDTRSAVATSTATATLRSTIRSEVAETTGDPGRYRLGVTSLAPILENENGVAVVDALREAVLEVNGMGHYHLSAPVDVALAPEIAEGFDAVVELRLTAEGAQQRWHLRESDLRTPWIPIGF